MANCVSIASALIVLEFASIFYQIDSIGTILHHPQSRLVPVGVEVAFTCIVRDGLNPHWVINGQALSFRDSIERISAEEGFIIQRQETTDHASSLSLMFNTTMEKNGTTIYCSSFNTHSDEAILLVMSETPLIPNPLITNPNKSSVLLKWSPPFLWPGSVIDHYLVSVVAAEESDTFYHVNATFSDAVVSFLKTSGNATEIRNCNEILFCISAITDNGTELASFTVVGGYLPNSMNITLDNVNVTVLFESDGSPFVIVNIKFPQSICSYQYVNYSIYIEGGSKVFRHGPYQQYGPSSISKSIASSLKEDKSYSLMVVFDTQAGVFYSLQYSFNTSLQLDDRTDYQMNCSISLTMNAMESYIYVYKVTTSIFVGVTVVILLLIFIMSLGALCQRKLKRTAILANSTNRVFNEMTHNPIYDGPIYDSIAQTQFDTLPTNLKASDASADEQIILTLSRPLGSDQNTVSENDDYSGSVSPKRYVSAPSADIVNASEISSPSVGIVAANNKVFDTLPTNSECPTNDGNLRINETPKSKAIEQTVSEDLQSKDDEDSKYTVMEPIGAIAFSLDTPDNGFGQLN